jgi:hypothetical protein
MARSSKTRPKSSHRSKPRAPIQSVPHPSGKLGLIVERVSAKTGATIDELVEITGWRRPSVLGALSRLRSRGFAIKRDVQPDRSAYRLTTAKG